MKVERLKWICDEETSDHLAEGWVIIKGYRRHSLYKLGPNGMEVGDPYRVGTLEECQMRADELQAVLNQPTT